MKIGVLSDTHDEVQAVQRAVNLMRSLGIEQAIHCGDIGAEVIPLLNGLRVHFVNGNMDDRELLCETITDPEHKFYENIGEIELEGRRVAFLHGHDVTLLKHTIHSGHWDMVCHGHTHTFSSKFEGRTLVLNPGALARTTRPTLAVVEMSSLEVSELSV